MFMGVCMNIYIYIYICVCVCVYVCVCIGAHMQIFFPCLAHLHVNNINVRMNMYLFKSIYMYIKCVHALDYIINSSNNVSKYLNVYSSVSSIQRSIILKTKTAHTHTRRKRSQHSDVHIETYIPEQRMQK